MGITCRINALRGRSSVVERHVANVNVEGSTPFARFSDGLVSHDAGPCPFVVGAQHERLRGLGG